MGRNPGVKSQLAGIKDKTTNAETLSVGHSPLGRGKTTTCAHLQRLWVSLTDAPVLLHMNLKEPQKSHNCAPSILCLCHHGHFKVMQGSLPEIASVSPRCAEPRPPTPAQLNPASEINGSSRLPKDTNHEVMSSMIVMKTDSHAGVRAG